MMSRTKNGMTLFRYTTLGAVAGRSHTDSAKEADFLNTIIAISLRLQSESRYIQASRSLSRPKAFL
jgi:hypothetical protein